MKGLYTRLDMKPERPSEDEMVKRFRSLERRLHGEDLAHMLGSQCVGTSKIKPEMRAMKWALLKHRIVTFFKDFDHYIDYCIARFLFWRELRRQRKRASVKD